LIVSDGEGRVSAVSNHELAHLGTGFLYVLGAFARSRVAALLRAKETLSMKLQSIIGLAAAMAIATATSAVARETAETVTPQFKQAITNIPGKSLIAVVVDYAPGGASPSHTHAKSAFIFGYVLSGEIESQVNDGPMRVYRVGESFYEPPGSRHTVSRNASKTKPAKLLAVFVVDTDDKELTTPLK
jgi:quercetin dioxygenase-like cupin family protein